MSDAYGTHTNTSLWLFAKLNIQPSCKRPFVYIQPAFFQGTLLKPSLAYTNALRLYVDILCHPLILASFNSDEHLGWVMEWLFTQLGSFKSVSNKGPWYGHPVQLITCTVMSYISK